MIRLHPQISVAEAEHAVDVMMSTATPASAMAKYTTLKDFLDEFRKAHATVLSAEVKTVGQGYSMQVVTGTRDLEFHAVAFEGWSEFDSRKVGYLNGIPVVLDKHCCYPKMEISKEFMRIQHAELSYQTNEWMRKFFGMVYPIYVVDGRIVMHPVTFDQLQQQVF